MKRLIIILLLIIPILVFGQSWPVDSFTVKFSNDFEDNIVGPYSVHPTDWESDWIEDYDWFKNNEIVSIKQKGATQVMEFVYPEGTVDGVNQGTDFMCDHILGLENDSLEMYFSSDVMFKPGFQPVISGKINTTVHGGYKWTHSGKPTYYEGFKVKLIWMRSWEGYTYPRIYIYHHDMPGESGETKIIHDPDNPSEIYYFPTAEETWVNLTFRIVVNTVNDWEGSQEDGNKDGFVEVFINGKFAEVWDGLRLRNVDTIGINNFRIYSQFGGSDPMFTTTRDEWLLSDNYYMWNYKWGLETVPFHYTKSPTGRILHIPTTWTNTSLNYNTTDPEISNLEGQTIYEGQSFNSKTLDNNVIDPDDLDEDLVWSYSENIDIDINITDRIATITYPAEWTGQETVEFRVEDPDGNADSVYVTFRVLPTEYGTTRTQKVLINLAEDPLYIPPTLLFEQYCNHMTFDEQIMDSIYPMYNTEGENSGIDFILQTSGNDVSENVFGYRGTDYPDTCEYTYWLVASTSCTIELDGFIVGESYDLKTYSSYIGGDGGNTTVTFLDTAKVTTVQNNTVIKKWIWTADATSENLLFSSAGYGFLNIIEINEYLDEGSVFVRNKQNIYTIRKYKKVYHFKN